MHSPAHTDMAAGLLTRFRWRTRDPRPLGDQHTHCPGTPSMPSHGRRRQEHPVTQSLSHCAWCFPISGAAVQQAGGHGGRTQSEYSGPEQENKILRHGNHAKKMSACGHQPSCSNRLGESSRLAVFLLFYKEKGFYARPLVTPAGVI